MEFNQKKTAIEQGLTPFLSGEPLAFALQIWETKYASEPTFALARFVNELRDSLTLSVPSVKLLQSLIRALTNPPTPAALPDERLLFDEGEQAAPTVTAPAIVSDSVRVCALLVDTLISRLTRDEGDHIRQYMLNHLKSLKQPEPLTTALRGWLSQQQPLTLAIPEAVLTRIVNLAYIALCECRGPSKADRDIHEAVQLVEQLTAGSEFPVRRLL